VAQRGRPGRSSPEDSCAPGSFPAALARHPHRSKAGFGDTGRGLRAVGTSRDSPDYFWRRRFLNDYALRRSPRRRAAPRRRARATPQSLSSPRHATIRDSASRCAPASTRRPAAGRRVSFRFAEPLSRSCAGRSIVACSSRSMRRSLAAHGGAPLTSGSCTTAVRRSPARADSVENRRPPRSGTRRTSSPGRRPGAGTGPTTRASSPATWSTSISPHRRLRRSGSS
jgi:hypothetical protein